ncbi:MAG: sigma-70 family RNA polymerase sigma factor [Gammaproteobacteria bacterium]|nr:sigma-70 family RNA polymerase sigma factor [Gammaproteobacteria bacterium]
MDAIAEPFTDETPQDILSTIQQDSYLHEAMNKIKPQQRQLLSLAYFKGLTHSEIADYTKLPLGTVKTQIRRAIIMLKELMGNESLPAYKQDLGGNSYE